jgi:steroid delta-isomerase-like uncharacterized protein
MSEENKNLVRRWFEEVWNQGRLSAIDELFDRSGKAYGWPDPDRPISSPEEFAAACKTYREAFPDIHMTVDDLVAEGDKVAVRWTATMTHLGNSLGFPASAKKARLSGSSFLTCGKGRILNGWNYMDLTRLHLELQDKLDML